MVNVPFDPARKLPQHRCCRTVIARDSSKIEGIPPLELFKPRKKHRAIVAWRLQSPFANRVTKARIDQNGKWSRQCNSE
jgi:hypothetical protein